MRVPATMSNVTPAAVPVRRAGLRRVWAEDSGRERRGQPDCLFGQNQLAGTRLAQKVDRAVVLDGNLCRAAEERFALDHAGQCRSD